MPQKSRMGMQGVKYKISLAIPVGCQLACADNSGAKLLNVISVFCDHGTLNRLPSGSIGDVLLVSVRKGKPDMRKKLMRAVIVRQRKPWRRVDGSFIYCEDNAGVIITTKGDPKGSAINGPVAKECGELFPKIVSNASAVL